ncbi:unnamed protein product [Paramecium primaurelia]|uniref:Uncharacterized protein n=1 Tax=Paramecium primaurelia TaxID=5886 RepID=A0A8S1PVP3_PARPR|nr:unnamed protein product [Paramecium primaurelia]
MEARNSCKNIKAWNIKGLNFIQKQENNMNPVQIAVLNIFVIYQLNFV